MARRLVLRLIVLAVLVAPALVACSRTPAGPTCGGVRTMRTGARTWTCSFDDEFDGDALDRGKWAVQTTPASGWTTSDTCYVDHPATIGESGGALHLVAVRLPLPRSCGGRYATTHTGGAVMTKGHFSQTYGLFVVRARFPATSQAGFWGDLWLYPEKLTYGRWPASGEIDIAEHWSGHGDAVSASLHYPGSSGADSHQCSVGDVGGFHTYAVEWSPTTMTFSYDGTTCFERSWASATGSGRPFDQPFFVMLSEGFGDFNLPFSPALPATGPVDVDYVRVYR